MAARNDDCQSWRVSLGCIIERACGSRKAAYKVFYKDVYSDRMFVRLTDKARADVREKFGKKEGPANAFHV